MGLVSIGVDIGQRVDPTAIAVVEVEDRAPPPEPERIRVPMGGSMPVRGPWEMHGSYSTRMNDWLNPRSARPARSKPDYHHIARHLERLPLGTPYPKVAERIAEVVAAAKERTGDRGRVYLDATGVGQPVVDLVRAAGVQAIGVYFTHGDRRTVEGQRITLGKAWLVSRLQALLQSSRLHLPRTDEAEALAKELLDYEIRVSEDANDRYGAFRVGSHDDLVTALGLAVQVEPVRFRVL